MRPPFPRRRRRRPDPEARAAVLFLLPSLAGTAVFVLLPFAETVRRSFFDTLGRNFVGLANYRSVLGNSAFRLAAKNTARFVCTCVPLLLAVSLLLALGVRAVARRRDGSETRRGRLFRTSFLLPMAIPVASIVVLWQALFAQSGLVNGALAAIASADTLIVAGTSLTVYPAAGFIDYFRGENLILINRDETPLDSSCTLVVHGKVGETLGALPSYTEETL